MKVKLTYLLLVFLLGIPKNSFGFSNNEIQRVRIDVETPLGYVRHLLIGFTPDNAATDGFDYGYDAPNIESFPDDSSWMIEGDPYVIQGVGAFDDMKKYPIGLFLSNSGDIQFSLLALENFDQPIGVYIYDDLVNQYYRINEDNFSLNVPNGIHENRFYLAFKDHNAVDENLGVENFDFSSSQIFYHSSTSHLNIRFSQQLYNVELSIFNLSGKQLMSPKFYPSASIISEFIKLPESEIILVKLNSRMGNGIRKLLLSH